MPPRSSYRPSTAVILLIGVLLIGLTSCRPPTDDALLKASRDGDMTIVETVVAQGANVNSRGERGWTPLMWAAARGHSDAVKFLLDHGAKTDLQSSGGVTPLMWAALDGHAGVVTILLEYGADVNARDRNGSTALMAASQRGHHAAAHELLKRGAEIHAQDRHGETALLLAVRGEYLEHLRQIASPTPMIHEARDDLERTVRILLESGADPEAKGKDGKSAAQIAAERGWPRLARDSLLERNPVLR